MKRFFFFLSIASGISACQPTADSQTGCIDGDCENGQGTWRWESGSVYKGEWKNGQKHGIGVQSWGDQTKYKGEKYNGEWKHDLRDGQGLHTWDDGNSFEGTYEKDSKVHGKLSYNDHGEWHGDYYEGEFINDLPGGYGVYYDASQDILYEGNFENYQRHGEGTLIFGENSEFPGFIYKGVWNHNQCEDLERTLESKRG